MTSIDRAVEERFAQILAGTRAKSADISDRVEAAKQRVAEESRQLREQNERLCKELDDRSAAKVAAKDDPTARNEWLKRDPSSRDTTFQFGETDEPAPETTERTAPPAPPTPPAAGRRGRHARDDFDDDDFSNNSWLN